MKQVICSLVVLALIGSTGGSGRAQTPQYRIANRISLEGDGGWDLLAVDGSTGRLFLSHSTMVQVVDPKSGTVLGTIPDTRGVHGIALAADLNRGYATCGKDTTVAIFNLTTLEVVERLRVTGANPDAILYEPVTHRVFVFNGGTDDATVIDGVTGKVIGTVPVDGKPELCASDRKGMVFVNLEDSSAVDVINAKSLKVEHRWSLSPGEEPTGMAIDNVNHRLFIGCNNKLMIIMDAENGKVVATLPIGEHVDGVGFDPGLKRAYSSNGDGTLTVVQEIDKGKFNVLENVATQAGARTLAVDYRTHHIFLPTAEFGETPAPTPEHPRPRPAIKPGSFVVLDVEPIM